MSSFQNEGIPISVNPVPDRGDANKPNPKTKKPTYNPSEGAAGADESGRRKKIIIGVCGAIVLSMAIVFGIVAYSNWSKLGSGSEVASPAAFDAQREMARLQEELAQTAAAADTMTVEQRQSLAQVAEETQKHVEEQSRLKQEVAAKHAAAVKAEEEKAEAEHKAELMAVEAEKIAVQLERAKTEEEKNKYKAELEQAQKEKEELNRLQAELADVAQRTKQEAEQKAKEAEELQKSMEATRQELEALAKSKQVDEQTREQYKRRAELYADMLTDQMQSIQLVRQFQQTQSQSRVSVAKVVGIMMITVVIACVFIMTALTITVIVYQDGTHTGFVPLDKVTLKMAEVFADWGWIHDPRMVFPIVPGPGDFYDFMPAPVDPHPEQTDPQNDGGEEGV